MAKTLSKGSRNFFRHNYNARNDAAVESLVYLYGMSGYAYWFTLLEYIAAQVDLDNLKPIEVSIRALCQLWRLRKPNCMKVLDTMQENNLIFYKEVELKCDSSATLVPLKCDSSATRVRLECDYSPTIVPLLINLSIPNLPKYMGYGDAKMPIDREIDREIDNSVFLKSLKENNETSQEPKIVTTIEQGVKEEFFKELDNYTEGKKL